MKALVAAIFLLLPLSGCLDATNFAVQTDIPEFPREAEFSVGDYDFSFQQMSIIGTKGLPEPGYVLRVNETGAPEIFHELTAYNSCLQPVWRYDGSSSGSPRYLGQQAPMDLIPFIEFAGMNLPEINETSTERDLDIAQAGETITITHREFDAFAGMSFNRSKPLPSTIHFGQVKSPWIDVEIHAASDETIAACATPMAISKTYPTDQYGSTAPIDTDFSLAAAREMMQDNLHPTWLQFTIENPNYYVFAQTYYEGEWKTSFIGNQQMVEVSCTSSSVVCDVVSRGFFAYDALPDEIFWNADLFNYWTSRDFDFLSLWEHRFLFQSTSTLESIAFDSESGDFHLSEGTGMIL